MGTRMYLIGQGYSNLRKHPAKTFSTMLIICATMLILGLFIIALVNIEANLNTVVSQQGLQAFISDYVKEEDINFLVSKINNIGNVKEIKYLDKNEALKDAKETLKEYEYLLDGLETSNPFPRSFIIIFNTLEDTESVKQSVESIEGIYKVSYNEAIIDAVLTISDIGKIVIFGIGAVMIVVSIFIIANTIKLAVYSNKREIYIMKYIGATSKFIRSPFITEGILMGLGSAALSWVLVSLAYVGAYTRLPKVGSTLGVFGFVPYSSFWYITLIAFLLLGVFLGGIGSSIATRKYLKEFKPVKIKNKKENTEVEKEEPKKEEQQEIKMGVKSEENAKEEVKVGSRLSRRNRLRVFLIGIAITTMTFSNIILAATTSEKIEDVKAQQSEAAKKYDKVVSDIKIYEKDIESLDSEIDKYSEEVDTLTAKVQVISEEVEKLEANLQGVSATYQATQDILNIRLRALYENGFVNVWEVLLTSEGVTDFIAKYNVIISLVENDKEMLDSMQSQKEYINNLKKDAELRKLQIEQVEYDVNKSKQALENAKSNKVSKLDKLEASKKQLKEMQAKLRAEEKALEKKLAAEIAASKNSKLNFNGEFTWPVPGVYKISALFRDKEYYRYIGSVHNGTDIDGNTGDKIVAAQTGTVITASGNGKYNYGYGNYIIIDHGKSKKDSNKYVTLYAHLKSVSVKKGQVVTKGQLIGYMGNTGFSTGSHLHFELRKNGKCINAMNYYPELSGKAKYYSYGKWITFSTSTMSKYMM